MRLLRPLWVGGAVLSLGYACGGATGSDLFSGAPGATDAGSLNQGPDDAGGVTNRRDGSLPTDGGNRTDSGGIVPGSNPKIDCAGVATCDAVTQLCCADQGNSVCVLSSGACPGGNGGNYVPVRCDDTSDCLAMGQAQTVCCGTVGGGSRMTDVRCRPPGQCTAGLNRVMVCDPNGAATCSGSDTCSVSVKTLPGFGLCGL